MSNVFRDFLAKELHDLEANHPAMRARNRAKYCIIASAIPIVPLSVFILIITMFSWDAAESFDGDIWVFALLHPFASCAAVMIAMNVHKLSFYLMSAIIAVGAQVITLGGFLILYIRWAVS